MSRSFTWRHRGAISRVGFAALAAVTITGCDEAGNFTLENAFATRADATADAPVQSTETEYVEKDVEAPEVFRAKEAALWDGRPSLGGVWIAHPDVKEPERVRIRSETNGQTVVGALFRRERDIPGPRLQLSSDAAAAIGVLAGAPVSVEVVALRKEQIPVEPPVVAEPDAVSEAPIDAPDVIEETALDPIEAASAAIEAADPTPATASARTPASAVAEAATANAVTSTLPETLIKRPYVQVATFTRAENATRASDDLRKAGMVPTVREQDRDGTSIFRVLVGPSVSEGERDRLVAQIRKVGYSDAYPVSN